MATFTDEKIQAVWNNAKTVPNQDSNLWRKDSCDAWINRGQYGVESDYGWEIDHILPVSKDGTDHTGNLRAMHWKNNRSKGDDFPNYNASITSSDNKNIEKQERKVVNQEKIRYLKGLYPSNNKLQSIKD